MKYNLPVVLLKGLITLPDQEIKLEINNIYSKKTISLSKDKYDSKVLVICPKNQKEEEPDVSDLPKVGVIANVLSSIKLPNGNDRVILKGIKRVAVNKYYNSDKSRDILLSKVEDIDLPKLNQKEKEASRRKLISLLRKFIKNNSAISNSILSQVSHVTNLDNLTDMIASFLPLTFSKKLDLMQEINANKRAKILIEDIMVELEIIALENKIDEDLKIELDNSQKEFILKEKIKLIKQELGEKSGKDVDIQNIYNELNKKKFPDNIYKRIQKETKKYEMVSEISPESSMIINYIDILLNLPWNKSTKDDSDINLVEKRLNKTHYGLEDIKKRVLEYLYLKKINPDINTPVLCLVGPPGVGKSTFAASIANAINRKFVKISVGGLNDSAELTGHRKTYVGSAPGKIINAYLKCQSNNPVILIDEVDKMVKDYKGDPASTLLDILDINQNKNFVDNYLDEPFDLSKTFFILTANNIYNIPVELRDRLEIIELSSYTEFDKANIVKKHLLPKLYDLYKIKKENILIKDREIKFIINSYTKEPGIRDLERTFETLYRKILISRKKYPFIIMQNDIIKYLGTPKYEHLDFTNWHTGCVNCLAYTAVGGEVLPVEASYTKSSMITGLLGNAMKESVSVVNSYIYSHLKEFNLRENILDRNVHVHFLDGSTPKEGPSAGVSTVTVLLSLFKNKMIPRSVAMTGEITLSGNILKVGGLKEKLIGAYNNKVKKVYIPKANESELSEIPDLIKEKLNIKLVSDYKEIYNDLF
ncbi:MAG: endopeptidase La [Bacilli bacterium]|nr:endopeptidase La [Bacilli bacterium]